MTAPSSRWTLKDYFLNVYDWQHGRCLACTRLLLLSHMKFVRTDDADADSLVGLCPRCKATFALRPTEQRAEMAASLAAASSAAQSAWLERKERATEPESHGARRG